VVFVKIYQLRTVAFSCEKCGARGGRLRICRAEPGGEAMPDEATVQWSHRVTQHSDALDLEEGVFTLHDPREIALSLQRSAERSRRRKAEPFRSAMSMLTFYINRAGSKLPDEQRARLEAAKNELRALYGKLRR
jgi:hypothetical protein